MKQENIYNGFNIRFDEKEEVWYALVSEDGTESDVSSPDTRVQDASLKKLKERLDLIKRKKFERRKVLIQVSHRYRYGGGRDEKYDLQFTEGVMTSVSPNGTVWVVPKGEKHPEKFRIHVYSSDDIGQIDVYEDTPENRAIIAQIEKAGEAEWRAEVEQNKARKKLKGISGSKLYKEIYGKNIKD